MSRASSYGMATTTVGRKDITFFEIRKTFSKKNLRETKYKPICHLYPIFQWQCKSFPPPLTLSPIRQDAVCALLFTAISAKNTDFRTKKFKKSKKYRL